MLMMMSYTNTDKIPVSGPSRQPEQADGQQGGACQGARASHCSRSTNGGQGGA